MTITIDSPPSAFTSFRQSSVLVPPINFSLVTPGIYRSGHPNRKNFTFLETLKLKTMIYVEGEIYRPDSQEFIDTINQARRSYTSNQSSSDSISNPAKEEIALYTFDLTPETQLFNSPNRDKLINVLKLCLDSRNYPILIHDDTGKSTVSLICGLLRRFQGWSLTGIFAEGDMFAGHAGGSEGVGVGEAGREVSGCVLNYITLNRVRKVRVPEVP